MTWLRRLAQPRASFDRNGSGESAERLRDVRIFSIFRITRAIWSVEVLSARWDSVLRQLPVQRFSIEPQYACRGRFVAGNLVKDAGDVIAFDVGQSLASRGSF